MIKEWYFGEKMINIKYWILKTPYIRYLPDKLTQNIWNH